MKRISKLLVTLIFSLCIVLSSASAVSAAGLAKVTGLKVSSYSVSSVKLAWSAVKSAKKYQIRVYEGSSLKKTITTSDSKTSYTVTGLKVKKAYKFAVRAYNSGLINGAYSSTVSATTGVAKVANLKASTAPTTVKLTWSKVSGATGYVVEQKKGDKWKAVSKPTKNTCTIKDLTPNKKVSFRVYAYTKTGGKTYKSSTVKIDVTPKVAAVASLKASAPNCSSVTLTWAKVSGASGYIVQQKNGDKWKTVSKPTKNTCTIKNLTPNKTAEFRVYAFAKIGKKTYKGSTASIKAKPTVAAVSTFTSGTSYASATLKWSAAAGAKGYQIQYATKSDYSKAKTVKITDPKTLTYKLSSLKTGTTYYLRIRAYQTAKVSGKTKTYNSSWKTLTITPAISNASGLKYSSVSTSSAALSWTKVSGASGYQIVYATSSNFKSNKKEAWVKDGSTVTATLSKLATGTNYFVRVRAYRTVDGKNVYSGYSNTVSFVTAPAQVTGLALSAAADTSLTVKWTATTASKYIVYYKASSAKSYSSAEVTTNSYTLSGLNSVSAYNFYVIAVNSAGTKGKASSVITLTTTGISKTAPSISASSVTANSVKVSWNQITGATGYQVQYGLKKNLSDAKTVTVSKGNTLSANVTGLNSFKTYYFRVIAYGVSSEGKTIYGSYSSIMSTKTLHQKVTGLKATGSDYAVTLTWNNLSYSGYNVYYKMDGASAYSKAEVKTNSHTLTNLDGSKTHYIYVRAVEDGSEGEASDTVTVKTSGLSKDKPTMKATYSDKKPTTATVSWTAVAGATDYRIYYNYKTGSTSSTGYKDVTTTSFTFPSLQSGTEYSVSVRARRQSGAGHTYGTESNAAVFATKPGKVSALEAVAGETSIEVQWAKTTCYAYYVTYKAEGSKTATTIKTQANKATLTGLTEGKNYTISVEAANVKDVKGTAASITASTYTGISSAAVNGDIITVNFSAITGAAYYGLQQYSVAQNAWVSVTSQCPPEENGKLLITTTEWKNVNSALVRVVAYNSENKEIFVSDPYGTLTTSADFSATADASTYKVSLKWKDDVAAASKVRIYNVYGDTYTEKTASADDTFTYYMAPGAIHRFAVYSDDALVYSTALDMPAINTSLKTNEAKNAQINYLVQAINNTKNDTSDYTVTAVSGGDLLYDTTYLKMGIDSTSSFYKLMFITALKASGITDKDGSTITCNSKEEIDEKLGAVLGEDMEGGFSNVSETFDISMKTYKNGSLYQNGVLKAEKTTASVEPFGTDASWKFQQTPADWTKAFKDVTTTKQADGTYKVVAVLKKETNASGYHSGFLSKETLDGSSNIDMSDIFGDGCDGTVKVNSIGETTITAVIDGDNHLVSYNVALPSLISMDMVVSLPIDDKDKIIINLDMNLDCKTNYTYSFVEEVQ